MNYVFQFGDVFNAWDELALGAWLTVRLSALSMIFGLVVAIFGALGLKSMQIFRYVVLLPAIRTVYPALTSQFILLMLNSSVCSAIAASELTAAANDIQSRTFRSFEVYFVVTAIYLAMSFAFSGVFAAIERLFLSRPGKA